MAQFEAFDPDVEVDGRTILTVVDDAPARRPRPVEVGTVIYPVSVTVRRENARTPG